MTHLTNIISEIIELSQKKGFEQNHHFKVLVKCLVFYQEAWEGNYTAAEKREADRLWFKYHHLLDVEKLSKEDTLLFFKKFEKK